MTRFERFNEIMFESYCKTSIENAINKAREKKAERGQVEQPFSILTDAVLYALSAANEETSELEEPCQIFHIQDMNFPIYNEKLSWALSHLMPMDREIVLLYFFEELKDEKVASLVHKSRATVARRRQNAMKRLRKLMEDVT